MLVISLFGQLGTFNYYQEGLALIYYSECAKKHEAVTSNLRLYESLLSMFLDTDIIVEN